MRDCALDAAALLPRLQTLPDLAVFKLVDCSGVTPGLLHHFTVLTALTELDLGGTLAYVPFGNDKPFNLEPLQGLTALQRLSL